MVASCGGEKVAQRTGAGAEGSILQKMLRLGEAKAPLSIVGLWSGAVTVTVAVASTCSGWQAGGGPIELTLSRNRYVPGAEYACVYEVVRSKLGVCPQGTAPAFAPLVAPSPNSTPSPDMTPGPRMVTENVTAPPTSPGLGLAFAVALSVSGTVDGGKVVLA